MLDIDWSFATFTGFAFCPSGRGIYLVCFIYHFVRTFIGRIFMLARRCPFTGFALCPSCMGIYVVCFTYHLVRTFIGGILCWPVGVGCGLLSLSTLFTRVWLAPVGCSVRVDTYALVSGRSGVCGDCGARGFG